MIRAKARLRRYFGLHLCAVVALFAGFAALTPATAEESLSILEYDERGRVIGLRRVEPGESRAPGRSQGDRPNRSSPAPAGADDSPAGRRFQRIIDGEILVANTPRGFENDALGLGFRVIERIRLFGLGIDAVRLKLPGSMTVPEAMEIIQGSFPDVTTEVNAVYDPSAPPPAAPASLARDAVSWTQVGGGCGRGIRIGIIDGVVDTNHPALAGQRLTYRSFHRKGWRPTAADHGTAIAAMMIGRPADQGFGGVLPGAELFAANIFGKSRDGLVGGDSVAILRALEWMIEMKVHVVNMSFAGGDHKLLRLAIEKARRKGIVAVASVGNWGSSTRRAYPAALESVIAVTAVSRDMRIYAHANKGDYVDFAAPGVRIWTAVPNGGKFQNGTSFATPFISALVGAAVARGAAPDPEALRARFGRIALDLGAPGRDQVFGLGFVIGEPGCRGEG